MNKAIERIILKILRKISFYFNRISIFDFDFNSKLFDKFGVFIQFNITEAWASTYSERDFANVSDHIVQF